MATKKKTTTATDKGYAVYIQRPIWQGGYLVVFDTNSKAAMAQARGMLASGQNIAGLRWNDLSDEDFIEDDNNDAIVICAELS